MNISSRLSLVTLREKADSVLSALFILHDPSSSRTDPNFVQFAKDILVSVVEETFSGPPRFIVGNRSPLLIHWIYQAASVYSRLLRVTENEDSGLLESLKLQLRTLKRRWMVAGIFSFFSFPVALLNSRI